MRVEPLTVAGAWHFQPRQHRDSRGVFLEAFSQAAFTEAVGHPFDVQQTNCSVSVRGAVRGVHFTDVPPGQAKYVTCVRGAVWDVVVDVRLGSATYGRWQGVQLDDMERNAVYLAEGLGHGFVALTDEATVMYSCSTGYAPQSERGFHPFDPEVGIGWPTHDLTGGAITPVLSEKDQQMPSLREVEQAGHLPTLDAVNDLGHDRRT